MGKKLMVAGLALTMLVRPALCQVVEESRSTNKERRESNSQAGQATSSISVGALFFGHLGMIESQGAAYLGYTPDQVNGAQTQLLEAWGSGKPTLSNGPGLLEVWRATCANFSRTSYTYSHRPELAARINREGGHVTQIQDLDLVIPMPMTAKPAVTEFAVSKFGDSVAPASRFSCLMTQTAVIEQATKKLHEVKPSLYAMPTDKAVKDALRFGAETWVQAESAKAILAAWDGASAGPCQVPTPTGLQAGKKSVLCGPLTYDMDGRRFVFSGMVMLDDQTVMGKQMAFARSAVVEKNQSRSKADGQKEAVKVLK